jgi:hypothetical protein
MTFTELLGKHRKRIHEEWMKRILSVFPAESAKFIAREKDRFKNPIGSTLQTGTTDLLDALVAGGDADARRAAIEGMIRLRAVQADKASDAVSFLFALRDTVASTLRGKADPKDLGAFETTIESLVLDAFDLYMQCREKVFEIRLAELKNRTFKLLEREGEVSLERGANR